MKNKAIKCVEIFIECLNYIIINYALSNMAMLLKHNPLFILFFASEIWYMENFWKKICGLSGNKVVSAVLLIACFAIHIEMVYFIGRVVGDIVAFNS